MIARTTVRSLPVALLWVAGIPLVALVVGNVSGWAPWIYGVLALAGLGISVVIRPWMEISLVAAPTLGSGQPAASGEPSLTVRRWFGTRYYPLASISHITVDEYKVSVPLTYIELNDGQHVGPLLTGRHSATFMRCLIQSLRDHPAPTVDEALWENVAILERYFRRSDQ